MLPDYADIRALTDRAPDWFDGDGVPRYAPFTPDMLGVYDKFAVLVTIGCQGCRTTFLVGTGVPSYSLWGGEPKMWTLPELAENFHYGDPPRHGGCVGETMQCEDYRIVEAWEMRRGEYEWVRVPESEKELGDAR